MDRWTANQGESIQEPEKHPAAACILLQAFMLFGGLVFYSFFWS